MDYNNQFNTNNLTNNEHTITMTAFLPTLSDNNKLIYRLSRTIRLLSFFDVILGLISLVFGNAGYIILVRLLCSISGYYGAKYYKYGLSFIYLIFITFTTIGEILLVFLYNNQYEQGLINENIVFIGILYQFIFFMLKLYILRFVCNFVSMIKQLSEMSKTELLIYETQPVEIIYW
jgi:hypothetical protein